MGALPGSAVKSHWELLVHSNGSVYWFPYYHFALRSIRNEHTLNVSNNKTTAGFKIELYLFLGGGEQNIGAGSLMSCEKCNTTATVKCIVIWTGNINTPIANAGLEDSVW